MKTTHVAFSDDSAGPEDRYKSLALVTLPRSELLIFRRELEEKLENAGVSSEFKWSDLRNCKYKNVASKFIEFILDHKDKLRIDIIIWDLQDRRHEVFGRDDKENLVRMYYHLVSTTFGKRWPVNDTVWSWFPDKQSSVDWDLLQEFIESKSRSTEGGLFMEQKCFESVAIKNITPSDSEEFPLIQVADLFAGLGAYSWGRFKKYIDWDQDSDIMDSLFEEDTDLDLSNSEQYRFKIIRSLNWECKDKKMQIAFKSEGGFYTHDPETFLNFWFYEPQGDYDLAPKRN